MVEVTETARARVAKLVESWDWPDPAILEDILALGDEAVPALGELLTPERLKAAAEDAQDADIVYYVSQLLGTLNTPQAVAILTDLWVQVDDDLLDTLPRAFNTVGPEAIGPLLAITRNEAFGWYPRTLASEVALQRAKDDPDRRKQVADAIRPIVTDYLARFETLSEDEGEVLQSLANDLVEVADAEARPLIEAALASGKIDPDYFDQEYLEETYQAGGDFYAPPPRPSFLEEYREEYRRYQQEEREAEAHRALLTPAKPPQPVVLVPRLGRNDPCWCGSGQKYKKCHLAQDEKEKVRL